MSIALEPPTRAAGMGFRLVVFVVPFIFGGVDQPKIFLVRHYPGVIVAAVGPMDNQQHIPAAGTLKREMEATLVETRNDIIQSPDREQP